MSEMLSRLVDDLSSALVRLEAALARPKDEFMRDSAIQRFEFTFELLWKSLKAFSDESGLRVHSPREALRSGFRLDIIADDPAWFRMLEDRNLTSHTYKVDLAEAIYERLPDHAQLIRDALDELRSRIS